MQTSTRRTSNKNQDAVSLENKLQAANKRIRELERQIRRTHRRLRLDETELTLLRSIADADVEDVFEVTLAEATELPKARLDYHLRRLVRGQYVIVSFTDQEFGESFQITQKGAEALFKKHRL